jgi:hypothetical protein
LKRPSYEQINELAERLPDEIFHDDEKIADFFISHDWTVDEFTIEWNKRHPDIWKD